MHSFFSVIELFWVYLIIDFGQFLLYNISIINTSTNAIQKLLRKEHTVRNTLICLALYLIEGAFGLYAALYRPSPIIDVIIAIFIVQSMILVLAAGAKSALHAMLGVLTLIILPIILAGMLVLLTETFDKRDFVYLLPIASVLFCWIIARPIGVYGRRGRDDYKY